ncbi:glycosyl transferase family 1 [Niabella ginsenosidivorans]|uniref:Glycosyl transferase family 1 n=1 Tax=Niabella ginsenosidivorans TaxID=1176587 RepID=A0A1A9HYE9_9BACT|nr:glycosyltransferase [Niabella ginsenosidivorans]ANH80448.1 glycosyl transferase family 1 [Niabella ginsenosidivorans]
MLKNKDIIIVGQQPWDTEIGSNCKDIALELSKNNRILYVNSPLDRITKVRYGTDPKVKKRIDIIAGRLPGIEKIKENLYNLYPDCLVESINWISSTKLFKFFNRRNNRKFANSILDAIHKLCFKDYLLFNDNEIFKAFYLKEFLKPSLSAYYSRDNIVGVKYWAKHGVQLEPELMAKSDLCLANSEYLRSYCKTFNPDSFYVGQGCDFTYFKDEGLKPSPEILAIPKPIIGYIGALWNSRLDLALLERIAEEKNDWSLVFIGAEDEEFAASRLHTMPNVYFLGTKKPETLASYIKGFDVCMNPQYINPITVGNYPRKIDEYLALGKPTIATKTEPMLDFKEYVFLAEDGDGYIRGIQELLDTDAPELQEARKKFALSHSWERSIQLILDAYGQTAARKGITL